MSQDKEKLTIAQALRRIKKLKGQIGESQSRATTGVTYDVKKAPAFAYKDSSEVMFALQDEVVELETRVAVANATNTVAVKDGEKSLAHCVRTLQEMKGRIAFLKGLSLKNEVVTERRVDYNDEGDRITVTTETTFKSDLSEQDRDTQVRALQDKFEALNNKVEDANHRVVI